jgi:hypothetical protein
MDKEIKPTLLPCPFCGSEDVTEAESSLEDTAAASPGVKKRAVFCENCLTEGPPVRDGSAVTAWNTRRPVAQEPVAWMVMRVDGWPAFFFANEREKAVAYALGEQSDAIPLIRGDLPGVTGLDGSCVGRNFNDPCGFEGREDSGVCPKCGGAFLSFKGQVEAARLEKKLSAPAGGMAITDAEREAALYFDLFTHNNSKEILCGKTLAACVRRLSVQSPVGEGGADA